MGGENRGFRLERSFLLVLAGHGDARTPRSPTLQCRALTPTSLCIFEPKHSGSAAKQGAFFPLQTHGRVRRHQPPPEASTVSELKQTTTGCPVAKGWSWGGSPCPQMVFPLPLALRVLPGAETQAAAQLPGRPQGLPPLTFPLFPEEPRLSPLPTGYTFRSPAKGTNSSAFPFPARHLSILIPTHIACLPLPGGHCPQSQHLPPVPCS